MASCGYQYPAEGGRCIRNSNSHPIHPTAPSGRTGIESYFMRFLTNELYHTYNRGNNRERIFFEKDNYLFFLKKIRIEVTPLADLLAYCLMPNHYHLLIRVKRVDGLNDEQISKRLSRKLGTLQSSYTQAINKAHSRTGSLFQQGAKSKNLESYGHICFHYIHQNPVLAGLCQRAEDWEFSSYRDYIGLRNGSLPSKAVAFECLDVPSNIQEFYRESRKGLTDKEIEGIR